MFVKLAGTLSYRGTHNEWIEIKNKSKKKVNLKDWSLASGWEKLTNHPIKKDFVLKPGKSKKLTSKYASITLNNTKSKIELRDPTGKIVDKIKYSTEDGVQEDTIYEKVKKKWQWAGEKTVPAAEAIANTIIPKTAVAPKSEEAIIPVSATEIQANLGKYSSADKKSLAYQPKGVVLGAATVKKSVTEIKNQYLFTPYAPAKHWAVNFLDYLEISANSFLNSLLLRFN